PQLPLEAAIVEAGGFGEIPGEAVHALTYWLLSGLAKPGEEKSVKVQQGELSRAEEALEGLERLVASFDNPDTPYAAVPRPSQAPRFNDYAHLSRRLEWGSE
ncbi:MAG: double-strand break repair protein AddB, partial [Alphaproteobacteria bacterium]